jgi:SHS2 domain-containing protein
MAERPEYTEIEHTADVGMELTARDERSAFEKAAACMFDLVCDLDTVGDTWREMVRVEARADDLQNMMVRWLSELLYLFETERVLMSSFDIVGMDEGVIRAHVAGEAFDPGRHAVKAELKAPTYHDLRIEEDGAVWSVRVIFDT